MSKVVIYSTPTCAYCKIAKEFFKKNNIEFTERDVMEDEKAREEMAEKSHQMGVPVIEIDGEIHVGFNRGELESALGLK